MLLIAPSLEITGGQSVQASRLMAALAGEPRVKVDFLPMNPRLGGMFAWLQRVKYVRTAATGVAFGAAMAARIRRYDVVHVFSASNYSFLLSAAPAMVLGRLARRKTVVNYRDGRAESHLAGWRSARLVRLADRIVAPSGYLVDVFARYGYRAQAIPNILDTGRFRYRARGRLRPVFLHNRGLEPLYNVPCTLRAFAEIQARYPAASLTLAHDGPLRGALEAMVREMGLRQVRFVGHVSQERMAELYDEAGIYLASPDIDCMPGSLLECYAAGLPVVATKAGGIPYIARHGETALLVEPGDHHGLAWAALRLLEDPELAARIAQNARAECAGYAPAAVARAWADLYGELTA